MRASAVEPLYCTLRTAQIYSRSGVSSWTPSFAGELLPDDELNQVDAGVGVDIVGDAGLSAAHFGPPVWNKLGQWKFSGCIAEFDHWRVGMVGREIRVNSSIEGILAARSISLARDVRIT